MTPLEIILCVVCPFLLLGWAGSHLTGRVWRELANFWRDQSAARSARSGRNQRREHPLADCIRAAGHANAQQAPRWHDSNPEWN